MENPIFNYNLNLLINTNEAYYDNIIYESVFIKFNLINEYGKYYMC